MTSKLFFFMPMPLNVELLDAVVLGCKEPVGDVALEPHHLLTDLSHVGNLRGQLQTEAVLSLQNLVSENLLENDDKY